MKPIQIQLFLVLISALTNTNGAAANSGKVTTTMFICRVPIVGAKDPQVLTTAVKRDTLNAGKQYLSFTHENTFKGQVLGEESVEHHVQRWIDDGHLNPVTNAQWIEDTLVSRNATLQLLLQRPANAAKDEDFVQVLGTLALNVAGDLDTHHFDVETVVCDITVRDIRARFLKVKLNAADEEVSYSNFAARLKKKLVP